MAQRRIIQGFFQDALGNPLAFGFLNIRLNTDATTGSTQVSAGIITRVPLDAVGNVSGIVVLWPNDQLSPAKTVYVLSAYDFRNQLVWKGELTLATAAAPYPLQGGLTNFLLQESGPLILQENGFGILIT